MSTPATASDRPRYMSRLYAYSRAYRRRLIAGILLGALGGGRIHAFIAMVRPRAELRSVFNNAFKSAIQITHAAVVLLWRGCRKFAEDVWATSGRGSGRG